MTSTMIAQCEIPTPKGGTLSVALWQHGKGNYEVEAISTDAGVDNPEQRQACFPLMSAARAFYCESVTGALQAWQHNASAAFA